LGRFGPPKTKPLFFRQVYGEAGLVLVAFHFRVFKGKIIFVSEVVIEILSMGIGGLEFRPDLGGDAMVVLNVTAREHDLQDIFFPEIF
jgi:hypothetical protein